MQKLLDGIKEFRRSVLPTCRNQFLELSKGQNPDVLFITCSDSRVAPNWFASTDPGDLFVVRNVGNLVPPASPIPSPTRVGASVLAAAEFSVLCLNVKHIVVCGHSECGAMNALIKRMPYAEFPHLNSWLSYGEPSLKRLETAGPLDSKLSAANQLSQQNVLQQVEHLRSHSFIERMVQAKQLEIHGWWFDIAKADIYSYESEKNAFQIIE